jgi:hypothetical protein
MKQEYRVSPLTGDRVEQAYPLARDAIGHPTLERWADYATTVLDDDKGAVGAGFMVAERNGYIRGMFSYRILPSLTHGRILMLQDFAVLEMAGSGSVVEALLAAGRDLAQAHGCRAIHTQLPEHAKWALDCFTQSGHHVENLELCLELA